MIAIITSSTVTTLSSVALAGTFGLIAILALLSLMLQKEMVNTVDSNRYRKLSQTLNIGIIPLLIIFVLIVAVKVIDVLR